MPVLLERTKRAGKALVAIGIVSAATTTSVNAVGEIPCEICEEDPPSATCELYSFEEQHNFTEEYEEGTHYNGGVYSHDGPEDWRCGECDLHTSCGVNFAALETALTSTLLAYDAVGARQVIEGAGAAVRLDVDHGIIELLDCGHDVGLPIHIDDRHFAAALAAD
jgi:hypothetical protein